MPETVLRTERLVLRPWRDDDLDAFAALNADPRVMEHFVAPLDRAASDEVASRVRAHFAEHGYGMWAVEVPGVTSFAGMTGLFHVPFTAPFTPAVEIGWRLAAAHWDRGYATEAARAALRFGFETLGLAEIFAYTAGANTRSRRVMDKLGMHHDASSDFDHPRLPEGSPLRRQVLYRVARP